MKQVILVGALVGAFGMGSLYAQADKGAGHAAPKQQPGTAPAPSAPTGDMALGSVRLPKAVKADGKSLAAGTYQVRLTTQAARPKQRVKRKDSSGGWNSFRAGRSRVARW